MTRVIWTPVGYTSASVSSMYPGAEVFTSIDQCVAPKIKAIDPAQPLYVLSVSYLLLSIIHLLTQQQTKLI